MKRQLIFCLAMSTIFFFPSCGNEKAESDGGFGAPSEVSESEVINDLSSTSGSISAYDTDEGEPGLYEATPEEYRYWEEDDLIDDLDLEESSSYFDSPTSTTTGEGRVTINPNQLDIPQAGEHNDNEEFSYFSDFLDLYYYNSMYSMKWNTELRAKVENRVVIAVYDENNLPLWNARVKLKRDELYTYQDGEVYFYPDTLGKSQDLTIEYEGFSTNLTFTPERYGRKVVQLPISRDDKDEINVDVVFLMDTTGSMGDEIEMLADTLYSIYMQVSDIETGNDVNVNLGMVLYRDTGDVYLTNTFSLTPDIESFAEFLFTVSAGGGGDTPEDLMSGLKAVEEMEWRDDAIKMVFLITDAPAQLKDFKDLSEQCEAFVQKGIKLYSIGASGLSTKGEIELRLLSQMTKGSFIFLTYGETGESSGAGTEDDPGKVSHHTGGNYQSRDLDDIVVDNVRTEITYQGTLEAIEEWQEDFDYTGTEDEIYRRVDNAISQIMEQALDEIDGESSVMILPPFIGEEISLTDMATYVSTISEEIIVAEEYLTVVTREVNEEIFSEMQLILTGMAEGDLAVLSEANTILSGKLYFVGETSVLFLRLVDVTSSEVMAASMVKI